MESKIRSIGKEVEGELYVIMGTYYSAEPMCELPNARILNIVPNGYWKIITLVSNNNIYRATFKFSQHTDKNADRCNHRTTINEIKRVTNINFYINDNIDNSVSLLDMLGCRATQNKEYFYSSYSY